MRLPPDSIVAVDRAYNDYRLFAKWTEEGVFFVTRMKENAVYEVIEERRLPLAISRTGFTIPSRRHPLARASNSSYCRYPDLDSCARQQVDLNPENRPCPRHEPEMTRRETSPASYFGQQ